MALSDAAIVPGTTFDTTISTLTHKRAAVICDLDGTLSDCRARQHLVINSPKRWDEFYDQCDQDPLNRPVAVIVNSVAHLYRVLLVSGRVERVRGKTVQWLEHHNVPYDALFMRPDGDHIEDDKLKERILDTDILPFYDVAFALDDRDRVVAMWRRRGITCLQVAAGNF